MCTSLVENVQNIDVVSVLSVKWLKKKNAESNTILKPVMSLIKAKSPKALKIITDIYSNILLYLTTTHQSGGHLWWIFSEE